MPAKSEAQRRYLNWKFGHAWVKKHHFDNRGKLPEKVEHAMYFGAWLIESESSKLTRQQAYSLLTSIVTKGLDKSIISFPQYEKEFRILAPCVTKDRYVDSKKFNLLCIKQGWL